MFQPTDPSAPPDEVDFQIDPQRMPYFQIMQPDPTGSGNWSEVGFVWVVGSSRVNSLENWFLYLSVPAGSDRKTYQWPGWNGVDGFNGTTLRLVPAEIPAGEQLTTHKAYLERTHGVTLLYVKSACTPGR